MSEKHIPRLQFVSYELLCSSDGSRPLLHSWVALVPQLQLYALSNHRRGHADDSSEDWLSSLWLWLFSIPPTPPLPHSSSLQQHVDCDNHLRVTFPEVQREDCLLEDVRRHTQLKCWTWESASGIPQRGRQRPRCLFKFSLQFKYHASVKAVAAEESPHKRSTLFNLDSAMACEHCGASQNRLFV